MSGERIVFVSAHPDDAELGCGGTIAKLVDLGHTVTIIELTDGEPTPSNPPGRREIRIAESKEADRILGCDREILDFENRVLFDSKETRIALGAAIRRLQPTLVLSQMGNTPLASPDHYEAHRITEAGAFYSQLTWWEEELGPNPWKVPLLMYYHTGREPSLEWVQNSFVVDISDYIDKKIEALRAYKSQFGDDKQKKRLFDYYRSMARYLGIKVGVEYGELFATSRIPTPSDFRFFG